jgi:hypothetical protein
VVAAEFRSNFTSVSDLRPTPLTDNDNPIDNQTIPGKVVATMAKKGKTKAAIAAVPVKKTPPKEATRELKRKTGVKAGGMQAQHNQTRVHPR